MCMAKIKYELFHKIIFSGYLHPEAKRIAFTHQIMTDE